jgi:large subunit ribosomal protein L29
MKANEIRQMTKDDLLNRLVQEQASLTDMRFKLTTSQLTNTSQLAHVRRDIARMKTVLKEWEKRGENK